MNNKYKFDYKGEGFQPFKLSELRDLLKENQLSTEGSRKEIIDRLEANNINPDSLSSPSKIPAKVSESFPILASNDV